MSENEMKQEKSQELKDIETFAKIVIIGIIIVLVFGGMLVYHDLTFVPPEEIVINVSQLNLE